MKCHICNSTLASNTKSSVFDLYCLDSKLHCKSIHLIYSSKSNCFSAIVPYNDSVYLFNSFSSRNESEISNMTQLREPIITYNMFFKPRIIDDVPQIIPIFNKLMNFKVFS